MSAPTRTTVELVWERDAGRCAWCREFVAGDRGEGWSLHHRRARGMGGDRRPDSNLPSNLVLLHGNGTMRCHGEIESQRADAQARGFLIPKLSTAPAAAWAIEHAFHGFCYLLDDGSFSSHPPEVSGA